MKNITQPQTKKPLFASEIQNDGQYHIVKHDAIQNKYVDIKTEPTYEDIESAMDRTNILNEDCPKVKIE